MGRKKAIKKIEDLVPDDKNANAGTEDGQHLIEGSIDKFGMGRPILADKTGRIIAGNKTLAALKKAGKKKIIVVPSDGDTVIVHQRVDLDLETQPEARELGIVDNRAAEVNLLWDAGTIVGLDKTFDMDWEVTGFSPNDIEKFYDAGNLSPEGFPEYNEDNVETNTKCPKCGYEFDE